MKPKVCFVSLKAYPLLRADENSTFVGGAELQQVLLGKELAKRGYTVSYVTMNYGQDVIDHIGTFKVIPTFRPNEGIPILRFVYPRLIKFWRGLTLSDADIYYLRAAGFILAPLVFFARLNKKKVIFCGANDPDFDPKTLKLPTVRDKWLYYWGLKRCDAVVVQNSWQQRMLLQNWNRRGWLIHNGLSKLAHMESGQKNILWVATLRKHKKPLLFITLAQAFPHEKFVMIGGGTGKRDDSEQVIGKEAERLPNLDYKGFLPLNEVENHFMRAKLFINTSSHEGFPNTFLQAWRRGIPVISFVDPDDVIKNNNLGIVVTDLDEMIEKVRAVLEEKITFCGQRIRSYFEDNLTTEKMVDRYEELFISVQQ